jgi:hypothetical protein
MPKALAWPLLLPASAADAGGATEWQLGKAWKAVLEVGGQKSEVKELKI